MAPISYTHIYCNSIITSCQILSKENFNQREQRTLARSCTAYLLPYVANLKIFEKNRLLVPLIVLENTKV